MSERITLSLHNAQQAHQAIQTAWAHAKGWLMAGDTRLTLEIRPEKRAIYEQNRRAKKRANGGRLSPGLKGRLYASQKGACACCRAGFTLGDLHLDHVMPLSKGGAHADNNMQLLCQPCNQSKYAKHPVDFMQERGYLL